MKTKFLSFALLVFFVISCQNDLENDLTLRLITSSKLTVNVVDNKGTSIPNVTVKLYDKSVLSSTTTIAYSSLAYINSATTDANGKVDFGDISSGTYFIIIDSVRINGLNYKPAMQFQMNNSVDKNITINPEDYVSTFNFSFQKIELLKTNSLVDIKPFNDLNVFFVLRSMYSPYYSLDKLISLAQVSGITNDNGSISLKAPSFQTYVAIVYNDQQTVFSVLGSSTDIYSSNYYSGDKGEKINGNFSLDSKTLTNSFYGIYNLSIKKAISIPTNTTPTLMAFDGLNVAALPYDAYDANLPISILLESAELSGKTNAEGNISFSLKSGINYKFIVYNNEKTAYSLLSNSSYNSFYINSGETRQASFIINSINLSPVIYTRISVTLSKTSSVYYSPNPTDLSPFSNLQVMLVPYHSNNSSLSMDELQSKAIASGFTDGNGQILFVLALPVTYNSSYYQIVAVNETKTNKFVSSMFSAYSGNTNSQVYTLNSISLSNVN